MKKTNTGEEKDWQTKLEKEGDNLRQPRYCYFFVIVVWGMGGGSSAGGTCLTGSVSWGRATRRGGSRHILGWKWRWCCNDISAAETSSHHRHLAAGGQAYITQALRGRGHEHAHKLMQRLGQLNKTTADAERESVRGRDRVIE